MTERLNLLKLKQYIVNYQSEKEYSFFNKYGKIKAESPIYNPNWEQLGELEQMLDSILTYVKESGTIIIKNWGIFKYDKKPPLLSFTIEGSDTTSDYQILFYGHIDKVPFGDGWKKGNPENPNMIDNRFYGRGLSCGFTSIFVLIGSLEAILNQGFKYPTIQVILESGFESGSVDLAYLINKALPSFNYDLIICLDDETPNESSVHFVNSMKGSLTFDCKIQTGLRSVHAGTFGGFIPEPFLIYQSILNKIENVDYNNNIITIPLLEVDISEEQKNEAEKTMKDLNGFYNKFPKIESLNLIGGNKESDNYLYSTLHPSLNIIGCDNIPHIGKGAAVINPYFTFRLNFGIPPSLKVDEAYEKLNNAICTDVKYNASVTNDLIDSCQGFEFNIDSKIWDEINYNHNEIFGMDAIKFRLARGKNYLQVLKNIFSDAQILCTGYSDIISGKNRKGDENVSNSYLHSFMCLLAYIINGYTRYKN